MLLRRWLEQIVSPASYARWKVLKARYIGSDGGVEKWRPLFAAQELYQEAMKKSGLDNGKSVWPVITQAIETHHPSVTVVKEEIVVTDPKPLLKEWSKTNLDDLACFDNTMTRIETDLDAMRARANAWATGDIAALQSLTPPYQWESCSSAFTEAGIGKRLGFGDANEKVRGKWLAAVDAALETWRKGAEVTMVMRGEDIGERVKYWARPDIVNRIKEGAIRAFFRAELTAIRSLEVDIRTPEGNLTLENDFVIEAARRLEIGWRAVDVQDRHRIRKHMFLEEGFHVGAFDFLVGQADYQHVVARLVEGIEVGDFLEAGRAPGRPEIHHHPFSALLGKIEFLAVEGVDHEGRYFRLRRIGGRLRRFSGGCRRSRGCGWCLRGGLAGSEQQQTGKRKSTLRFIHCDGSSGGLLMKLPTLRCRLSLSGRRRCSSASAACLLKSS